MLLSIIIIVLLIEIHELKNGEKIAENVACWLR